MLPSQYADFATLRGDASDGLPGVPGVGEKTAATLLLRFGDLQGIIAAAADPASETSRVSFSAADPRRGRLTSAGGPTVVTVVRDIDLTAYDATLPSAPRDPALVDALTERCGLGSAPGRLTAGLAGPAGGPDRRAQSSRGGPRRHRAGSAYESRAVSR